MPQVTDSMPGMPDGSAHGFLWLLGLNNGAYLAYNASGKSGVAPAPADAPPAGGATQPPKGCES